MNYFWLIPDDQRNNNFILYHEAANGKPVTLREQYQSLRCLKCNKFDEMAAIRLGLDAGLRIRAGTDFVDCDYGLVAVSRRFRELVLEHKLGGIEFATLPGDENYALMIPSLVAETDLDRCGLERHRVCPECGRARETTLFPVLDSMQLPSQEPVIFSSSAWHENVYTRSFLFLADQRVIDLFQVHKVSGVEYYPAY